LLLIKLLINKILYCGNRLSGWVGVLLGGDRLVDFEGIQDDKSASYARLVAEYAGVTYKD
jgi:hypothetical protein